MAADHGVLSIFFRFVSCEAPPVCSHLPSWRTVLTGFVCLLALVLCYCSCFHAQVVVFSAVVQPSVGAHFDYDDDDDAFLFIFFTYHYPRPDQHTKTSVLRVYSSSRLDENYACVFSVALSNFLSSSFFRGTSSCGREEVKMVQSVFSFFRCVTTSARTLYRFLFP